MLGTPNIIPIDHNIVPIDHNIIPWVQNCSLTRSGSIVIVQYINSIINKTKSLLDPEDILLLNINFQLILFIIYMKRSNHSFSNFKQVWSCLLLQCMMQFWIFFFILCTIKHEFLFHHSDILTSCNMLESIWYFRTWCNFGFCFWYCTWTIEHWILFQHSANKFEQFYTSLILFANSMHDAITAFLFFIHWTAWCDTFRNIS